MAAMAWYVIVASGTCSPMVKAAFSGFDIEPVGGGRIRMVGAVADEAALHGVLHRLQDLGLSIVDVHLIEATG